MWLYCMLCSACVYAVTSICYPAPSPLPWHTCSEFQALCHLLSTMAAFHTTHPLCLLCATLLFVSCDLCCVSLLCCFSPWCQLLVIILFCVYQEHDSQNLLLVSMWTTLLPHWSPFYTLKGSYTCYQMQPFWLVIIDQSVILYNYNTYIF